jgi:hypothetical protein
LKPSESPLVQGASEAFLTVARSPVVSFVLGAVSLGLAILAFFASPLAGAIVFAALLLSFSGLGVYALILRDRFGGLYEAIVDESEWDIHDASGAEAVLTRKRKLRFLQNGVFAIRDYAWGDGDVLADYQCSPGVRVDTYGAAGKKNIVISLRETKKRGDVETYLITRQMKDMFPAESEWVATEISLPTQTATISVRFPADRPPSGAWLRCSSDPDHVHATLPIQGSPDGRHRIEARVPKPRLRETYTIWWDW